MHTHTHTRSIPNEERLEAKRAGPRESRFAVVLCQLQVSACADWRVPIYVYTYINVTLASSMFFTRRESPVRKQV